MNHNEFDKSFEQAFKVVTMCSLEHSCGEEEVDCDTCPLGNECIAFWSSYVSEYKPKRSIMEYRKTVAWHLRNLWTLKRKFFKYRIASNKIL